MSMGYTRINITLPKSTVKKLDEIAKSENRNRSNTILFLVEKCYDKYIKNNR